MNSFVSLNLPRRIQLNRKPNYGGYLIDQTRMHKLLEHDIIHNGHAILFVRYSNKNDIQFNNDAITSFESFESNVVLKKIHVKSFSDIPLGTVYYDSVKFFVHSDVDNILSNSYCSNDELKKYHYHNVYDNYSNFEWTYNKESDMLIRFVSEIIDTIPVHLRNKISEVIRVINNTINLDVLHNNGDNNSLVKWHSANDIVNKFYLANDHYETNHNIFYCSNTVTYNLHQYYVPVYFMTSILRCLGFLARPITIIRFLDKNIPNPKNNKTWKTHSWIETYIASEWHVIEVNKRSPVNRHLTKNHHHDVLVGPTSVSSIKSTHLVVHPETPIYDSTRLYTKMTYSGPFRNLRDICVLSDRDQYRNKSEYDLEWFKNHVKTIRHNESLDRYEYHPVEIFTNLGGITIDITNTYV